MLYIAPILESINISGGNMGFNVLCKDVDIQGKGQPTLLIEPWLDYTPHNKFIL